MALTRTAVETIITGRTLAYLTEAGLSVDAGNNPALVDPIGWALRLLGYSPAELGVLTDADLAGVTSAHLDALLDLAELRTLETAFVNLTSVNVTVGPVREDRADLAKRLGEWVEKRRKALAAMYSDLLAIPLVAEADRSVRMHAL